MTGATLGYGVKLKMGDGGAPETFADIAEIKDLNDGDDAELRDVTNHQSAGSRREYIAGLIDGGELTMTLNYLPNNATQNRVTGLQAALRQTKNFRLEEPGNATGYQFAAVVQSVGRAYPVDDVMELSVTIKKTGAVSTYTVV